MIFEQQTLKQQTMNQTNNFNIQEILNIKVNKTLNKLKEVLGITLFEFELTEELLRKFELAEEFLIKKRGKEYIEEEREHLKQRYREEFGMDIKVFFELRNDIFEELGLDYDDNDFCFTIWKIF